MNGENPADLAQFHGMVVVGELTYNNNRVICNTCMYVPVCALYLYDEERLKI